MCPACFVLKSQAQDKYALKFEAKESQSTTQLEFRNRQRCHEDVPLKT